MYARLLKWELFTEMIPQTQKFVDWDISVGESHFWLGRFHMVINRVLGEDHGIKQSGRADESPS